MSGTETARAHEARWRYLRDLSITYPRALPKHPDWEIVVLFYAGLHLLQAYFSTKNQRFEAARHDERIRAIKDSPELMRVNNFLRAYRMLQDVSEQVRYEPGFRADDKALTQARQNLALLENVLKQKVARALN